MHYPPPQPDHADIIRAISESEARTADKLARIDEKTDRFLEGFPDEDLGGHRRYHESVIERREAFTRLMREVTAHLTKYGLLAAAAWVVWVVWKAFILEVTK